MKQEMFALYMKRRDYAEIVEYLEDLQAILERCGNRKRAEKVYKLENKILKEAKPYRA